MSDQREFDIIVFGASGYTGRLVAEYLSSTYGVGKDVRWAMAGRSADKLAAVRDEIGAPEQTPIVTADAGDAAALTELVGRTRVVLTTVGPYQLYGEPLLAACVAAGVDYVDLCGEPTWMYQMIEKHGSAAKASGARIVFSCGFDSIPFDLGVWLLQKEAKDRYGAPMPRVKGRVRKMQGTFSGGTAYSLKATMAAAKKQPELFEILRNPFALTMGFQGPEQPHGMAVVEDKDIGSWAAPFIMAPINTKNIHRTNALLGHAYGENFVYDEMMLTGPGEKGKATAEHIAAAEPMGGKDGPKPGEGPSKEERENGFYDILFYGTDEKGHAVKVGVKGDRDPGYGSTCKMITESALTLATGEATCDGGVWTPGSAMAEPLIKRLQEKAGLSFRVED